MFEKIVTARCAAGFLGWAALFAVVLTFASCEDDLPLSSREEELKAKLSKVGADFAWRAFSSQLDLLDAGFTSQDKLPSPPGALEKNMRVVSTSPYVIVIDDFMTHEECDFLRAWGEDRLKPALVVQSADNWYDTQLQTRNNEQVWLTQKEERHTPMLRHVLKRMHRATRVPDEYAEALQIGRYQTNQKYEGHIDTDPGHKVSRPTTMITYLSDTEEGGFTLFPVDRTDCAGGWRKHPVTGEEVYGAAACCSTPELDTNRTVRVYPRKGRSVIFYSHHPDGSVNARSTHIGCPVVKGEKWIAQRWFRHEPYNRVNYAQGSGWDPRFDAMPEERASEHDAVHLRVLSQIEPRVYLEEQFLSAVECNELGTLHREYGDLIWSKEILDGSPLLSNLTARALKMARLPAMNEVQLSMKSLSAASLEDSSPPAENPAVTVSAYLSTIQEGGELIFPAATGKRGCPQDPSECCTQGEFKVRPLRGDAVLIYAHGQDGHVDATAKHSRCPIVRGETIVAEFQFFFSPKPFEDKDKKEDVDQPKIRFDSQTEKSTWIFWVPPHGGKEVPMGEVLAGGNKELQSYKGHKFNVRDENGEVVDRVTVGNVAYQRHIITTKKEL